MTEKEKLQAGELYNSNDPELVAERTAAKKLCMEYNNATYNDYQKKERLLDRLVALRGENTIIEPDFFCDYGYNIILGDNFYVNHNCVILDCAEVIFGDNVFIGPNCGFYTAGHPLDATIGSNVVIGAGSVVTKDIPDGVVAVGSPCKPIKKIDADTTDKENQ